MPRGRRAGRYAHTRILAGLDHEVANGPTVCAVRIGPYEGRIPAVLEGFSADQKDFRFGPS